MEIAPYQILVEDFFSRPVPCGSCGYVLSLDEMAVMHPDSTVTCEGECADEQDPLYVAENERMARQIRVEDDA